MQGEVAASALCHPWHCTLNQPCMHWSVLIQSLCVAGAIVVGQAAMHLCHRFLPASVCSPLTSIHSRSSPNFCAECPHTHPPPPPPGGASGLLAWCVPRCCAQVKRKTYKPPVSPMSACNKSCIGHLLQPVLNPMTAASICLDSCLGLLKGAVDNALGACNQSFSWLTRVALLWAADVPATSAHAPPQTQVRGHVPPAASLLRDTGTANFTKFPLPVGSCLMPMHCKTL